MHYQANTPEEYIPQLPEDRREAIGKLRRVISEHLPPGFEEQMSYGMIGYVVPKERYPGGYHANPSLPLPFINLASQKNHIAIYHSGVYADKELLEWFVTEHRKITGKSPDMGKSCIRCRNPENIPFELIGTLAGKMSVDDWIRMYEEKIGKKK